jgi:hypothetical protein
MVEQQAVLLGAAEYPFVYALARKRRWVASVSGELWKASKEDLESRKAFEDLLASAQPCAY